MEHRRRSLLLLLLAGAAAPASLAAGSLRLGILGVSDWEPDDHEAPLIAELARRGYVQGRNLILYPRMSGSQLANLDLLASELVSLKVDIILCLGGTPSALAAKRATSTIPIVMHGARDPIGDGLVTSLARPGGNVTGNADIGAELMVKRLQILMEAVGASGPMGYLAWQPLAARPSEQATVEALRAFVRSKGRGLVVATVSERGEDLEAALAMLSQRRVCGVLANTGAFVGVQSHEQVGSLMVRYRLASIMEGRIHAVSGVLMTYDEPYHERTLRAVDYIDRIAKGASPGELPVSQATKFDLVINLKTARVLDISIPGDLLLRAAELIQ